MTTKPRRKANKEPFCKCMTVRFQRDGYSSTLTFGNPKTYTVYDLKQAICIVSRQCEEEEKNYKLVIVRGDGSEQVMIEDWPMAQYAAVLQEPYHLEMKPIKRQCRES